IIPEVEKSNPPQKLTWRFGKDSNGVLYELAFRPALHEIIDRNNGYLRYSTLNFLNIKTRLKNKRFQFQDFTLIEVEKMSTMSLVDSGFSWGVHVGLERDERMGGDRHIVQRNDLRFGLGQEFTNEISAYLVLQESLLTGNVSTALKLEHQAELRIIADFE